MTTTVEILGATPDNNANHNFLCAIYMIPVLSPVINRAYWMDRSILKRIDDDFVP